MSPKIEVPQPLSAQDKSGFAYKTMKDRLPVILVKIIDFFHRQRKELHKYGHVLPHEPSESDLIQIEVDAKFIIAEIAKLRKDLETNKPVNLFEKLDLPKELDYFNDDVDQWNEALETNKLPDGSLPRWFDSPWLLIECYLFRRLKDISLRTSHLKMFDLFVDVKRSATSDSIGQMKLAVNQLFLIEQAVLNSSDGSIPTDSRDFKTFMHMALWANKSDLSISGMSTENLGHQNSNIEIRELLDSLRENILCDNLSDVWFKFQSLRDRVMTRIKKGKLEDKSEPIYIDIVADNSGYELFVDLCLAHFMGLLLTADQDNQVLKFRFHLKRMPWFVSDCMEQDFHWLLDFMAIQEPSTKLPYMAAKWRSNVDNGIWKLYSDRFWTLPYDYANMKVVASDLYSMLQQSDFIIFKGDLNYRKLTGDRRWHILTPFRVALRGFEPAPLVALRTAKADVVVGIEDVNVFARINNNELPNDWMVSGSYGLIQAFL